jgi:quercetin dioxygenase-like cupin family protein
MVKVRSWAFAFYLAACATAPAQTPAPREVVIVRAATPANVDYADGVALALTPPGQTDYSQVRLVERVGYRTPLHVHRQTDETFLVLEGELTLFVNGAMQTLGPGDYALVPRGTPHAQGNRTETEAIVALTMAPGDFAAFFDARAEIVIDTPPGHPLYVERMMALGEQFDIEVLGPAPF